MVIKKLKTYADLVMFEHTLFALPYALAAVFMAYDGLPDLKTLFWVLCAMVGSRNGANALNRLVDAEIDGKNKRTAHRHIPSGLVKKKEVLLLTIFCFALFVFSAFMLNPVCVMLLPIPAALFIVYSYTKRFTWLCHLILGIAIGGAPVGAWLAVTGKVDLSLIPSFIMGASVALWIAGFDVIYATQDIEFDRKNKIHSIPARFGIVGALRISTGFHVISVILLLLLPVFVDLGIIYFIGIAIIAILLAYEHKIVSPNHLESVKIASYSVNQVIGVLFLVFSISDVLLGWKL
ncbi:4-hydroxybenzoate octaprenyltransferase [Oxobacter pfennigii]|uniref:4-hydroxybenzoate polyprenyltransferase n=1 Tax=Oxobacter pfennigii TaxID=36849 RepID=A0A0N8NSU9_9CLOT|nr:UbiA-like polyprenyltransferase [Oxobacter pfennigii]KPU43040.1 4-hydroxybenzoate octaprenyltransferase [Oxobacter pfennigii]